MDSNNKSNNPLVKKIGEIASRAIEKSAREKKKSPEENKSSGMDNKVIKLPSCSHSERTIPNIIARSALFGVIKRGARQYKEMVLIASREDVEIYYSGKTLDQADCTVWMQALAFGSTLGKDIHVNRALFLKLLGKTTGKKDYVWLNTSLHRLMTGVVTIKTKKYKLEFHLIDTWGRYKSVDDPNEYYLLNINQKVINMWANSEYIRVEWDKRLAIRKGCDLASWLQLYVRSNSNSNKPHHIKLHNLKEWCGLSKRRIDRFRTSMQQALSELVRIGEIREAYIRNDDTVVFTRISNELTKENTELDSRTEHRDSRTEHRDSRTEHRDSRTEHRDSRTEHRDSRTLEHRDSRTLEHRDSRTEHRDSRTNYRDSRTNYRDSRTSAIFKLLNLKKFLALFFS